MEHVVDESIESQMPSIREINAFLALSAEGSITLAANRMHLSQSQLSRILHALERKVETKLFYRSTAGLSLTPSGKSFEITAMSIHDHYLHQMRRFKSDISGHFGEVKLSILPSMAFKSLSKWTDSFRSRYPDATVTAVDDVSGESLQHLLEGQTDVAISACLLLTPEGKEISLFSEMERLKVIPLLEEQFFLVSKQERKESDELPWKVALEKATLGFTDQTSIHRSLEHIAHLEGIPYLPVTRSSSPLTIAGLVAAGLGSVIVPESSLDIMMTKNLATEPLSSYSRIICIVTANMPQTNLVKNFINTLKKDA